MEQARSLYEGLKASETNGVAAEKLGAGKQFEPPSFLRREGGEAGDRPSAPGCAEISHSFR